MTPRSLSLRHKLAYTSAVSAAAKLLRRILDGNDDAGIPFEGLRRVLLKLGFRETIRGSHHLFRRADVLERINLQADGGKAKVYQVRQVRRVLVRHDMARGE